MIRRCLHLGLVGALLLASGQSRAQQDPNHLLAKKHYELGAQLYKTSDYTRALKEFQRAYELSKKPGLLFNLARCHEVLANVKQAMDYYRLYLEKVPGASNRALVDTRLRNLKGRLKEREARRTPRPVEPRPAPVKPASVKPASEPASAPTPVSEGPADESQPGQWKRTAGWIALGTGGALLVTGIVFGAMASSKATEYEDEARTKTYDELTDLRDEGDSLQTMQIGLTVAGGVLAAAGAGLLVWGYVYKREQSEHGATVAPVVSGNVLGLTARLRF